MVIQLVEPSMTRAFLCTPGGTQMQKILVLRDLSEKNVYINPDCIEFFYEEKSVGGKSTLAVHLTSKNILRVYGDAVWFAELLGKFQ